MSSSKTATRPSSSATVGNPRQKPVARSTLTFSRRWLVHVANETLDIAHEGRYTNLQGQTVDVTESLIHSIKHSVHYHSSHVFDAPPPTPTHYNTETYVVYGSSLEVAAQLEALNHSQQQPQEPQQQEHIGILNSASSKTPSKFLRGTLSQEECLCRATLLFPCLAQFEAKPHHFYIINNKPKYQKTSSSCAIFSPKVPVIRHDTASGDLLEKPQHCSVVSICAPNAFTMSEASAASIPKAAQPGSNEDQEHWEMMTIQDAMRDRLWRALSIFQKKGCTDLVLCAFGCGVHGNSPDMVALLLSELLSGPFEGRFRRVAFAIHSERHANFEAFQKVFPHASTHFQSAYEEEEEPLDEKKEP